VDFITREANAEMTPLVRCWLRVGEDCATTVRNCSTAPTLGASLHAGGEPPSTCGFAEDLPSASSAAPTCSAIACNAVSETPVKAARAAHCSHVPKQRRCQRVASCRTTNPATSQRRLVVAAPMFRESTPPEKALINTHTPTAGGLQALLTYLRRYRHKRIPATSTRRHRVAPPNGCQRVQNLRQARHATHGCWPLAPQGIPGARIHDGPTFCRDLRSRFHVHTPAGVGVRRRKQAP